VTGYTFARVGAVVGMEIEDYYIQNRGDRVLLHEKGGKATRFPATTILSSSLTNG